MTEEQYNTQNLRPVRLTEEGKRCAPDENGVCLGLHLYTVARCARNDHEFWGHPMAAPAEIDPHRAVVLGDFGLGSDAPIVLDHRVDPPRVLRLVWNAGGRNHWVEMAPTFQAFIGLLELAKGRFHTPARRSRRDPG